MLMKLTGTHLSIKRIESWLNPIELSVIFLFDKTGELLSSKCSNVLVMFNTG